MESLKALDCTGGLQNQFRNGVRGDSLFTARIDKLLYEPAIGVRYGLQFVDNVCWPGVALECPRVNLCHYGPEAESPQDSSSCVP